MDKKICQRCWSTNVKEWQRYTYKNGKRVLLIGTNCRNCGNQDYEEIEVPQRDAK
jgi:predicted Zn-ribbon and HTH transcriptional regulator|uniref:Uncharacterized protein n=1 Tax=uncultured marine virus TaxID=186617 RepID=A0A0F7L523_9VIRU|nr:hypothetical protein [uncultured marine virus]